MPQKMTVSWQQNFTRMFFYFIFQNVLMPFTLFPEVTLFTQRVKVSTCRVVSILTCGHTKASVLEEQE